MACVALRDALLVVWEWMRVLVMQGRLVGAGCVRQQVLPDGQGPEQGITVDACASHALLLQQQLINIGQSIRDVMGVSHCQRPSHLSPSGAVAPAELPAVTLAMCILTAW